MTSLCREYCWIQADIGQLQFVQLQLNYNYIVTITVTLPIDIVRNV